MKPSRIAAAALVLAATGWIASGSLGRGQQDQAPAAKPEPAPFRVSVIEATVEPHSRRVILLGRTEAERRATAVARATGIIRELNVRRGAAVKTGEVIAVLSDEAREAGVAQAQARLEQRKLELDARLRLIRQGNMAAINRPQLEADYKAAEAALALATAERDRGLVLAPISGVVNDVPVEIGQALQINASVAEVIALQPMLAVVEVSERHLAGVKPGDRAQARLVTGRTVSGEIRFVSHKASPATRTYRVEVALDNADQTIPDGVTCEVDLALSAAPATRIPRSALTFSATGELGVRTVAGDGAVRFVAVKLVEDGQQELWVSGIETGMRVIVQGQDFVKDGEHVEAVPAKSGV